MTPEKLKNIVEAALMTSSGTMSVNQFVTLFEKDPDQPERADISSALAQLAEDYASRGIELKEVASGFRFQVRNEYADWVNRLFDEKPQRYSRALLETLAIIAYRQPVTRGEIEDIRGVSISSSIIKTLQEREWIRIVGHRDVPGKPELLATTRQFLDYFNLKKLADLPSLAEIKDFDKLNPDLFEGLEIHEVEDDAQHTVSEFNELVASGDVHDMPGSDDRTGRDPRQPGSADDAERDGDSELDDEKNRLDVGLADNVVPFST